MNKSKYRIIVYFLLFLCAVGFLGIHYLSNRPSSNFSKEILIPGAVAIILTSLTGILELYLSHQKTFFLWIKCKTFLRNKKSYVSLSYLLKIRLPGTEEYFLIKGNKIDQYQPVGGVYQSNKDIYKAWGASRKADRTNPKDLRFFVNCDQIPEIITWFESGKEREIGVWREFYEELIVPGILPPNSFQYLDTEFLRTEKVILKQENRFSDEKYHTLIYEIFQVNLSKGQLSEFEKLFDHQKHTEKYAFVTEDDINKSCFNNHKTPIGAHTKHII